MQRKTTYPPRFTLAALLTALGTVLVALGQGLGSLGARVAPTGDAIDAIDADAEDYAEDTHDDTRETPGMKHPVVRVPVEGTDNQETPRDPHESRYREHRPTPGETGDNDARSEGETTNSQELRGMGGLTVETSGPSGTWFEEVYSRDNGELRPFAGPVAIPLDLQADMPSEPSRDPTHGRRWDGPTVAWNPRRKSTAELVDEIQEMRDRMRAQGRAPLDLQAIRASEPSSDRAPTMSATLDPYDGLTGPLDGDGGSGK
jgi:hypothetical protein